MKKAELREGHDGTSPPKKPEGRERRDIGAGRAAISRITLNLVTSIALITITVTLALLWMAQMQNEQAEGSTKTMVLGGLGALEDYIKQFANDYSWWEAGYEAYAAGDREWVDENYGSGITDTQISDMIVIISPQGEIEYDWYVADILKQPKELYTEHIVDNIIKLTEGMPLSHDAARAGYFRDDDNIILLAVNRITPVSKADEVDPATLPLLVQAIYLNEERLVKLGKQFLIDDLHLLVSNRVDEVAGNFPVLHDMDGNMIGALVWTPPTPGYSVLQSIYLPMGITLGLFCIAALATVFRARTLAVTLTKTNEELDVSEGKLAEQLVSLAGEKEKIESIVSSIGEGLIAVDKEGKVFLCNSVGALLLGKRRETILGSSLAQVFGVDSKGGVKNISPEFSSVLGILDTRKTVEIPEVSFTRADGNVVILSLTATPIELGGAFIGGIIVFNDVTEQRVVEDAKRQFISTATHQLRTPLTGVKWALGLLVEGKKHTPTEKKALYTKSFESVNRIISLVNDLLRVDKIESKQLELATSPTDIVALIRRSLSDLKEQMEKKKLKVVFKPAKNIPKLNVDATNMRVVFQNLLENSLHYTKAKGVITVTAKVEDNEARISVADTGIGIPRGEQKSIFLRFFRASNAVTAVPNGSGLGLFICKEIIMRHGGKIWFESEENKGATFHVVLPLVGI